MSVYTDGNILLNWLILIFLWYENYLLSLFFLPLAVRGRDV